eukprot:5243688-Pyramimonas_sp.AAC.1
MLRFATGNWPEQPRGPVRSEDATPLCGYDPFHDRAHASSVLVSNARGFDLDDPTVLRHPDGCII